MSEKLIKVFYDQSGLPFKDKELTTHFPIVGSGFLGASNTTKIRFYFENIGLLSDTYLAVSKLPNGKQGSQLLNIKSSDENGQYAELSLSEWYFQAKGDVFIGLKVYRGGVEVEIDQETGFSIVSGDPVIMVTGSIKLAINYAPIGDVPDYRDEFTAYNDILALMGDKPDIDTVPLLVNFSDYATWGALYEYVGDRPFIAYVAGTQSICWLLYENEEVVIAVQNDSGLYMSLPISINNAISLSSLIPQHKNINIVVLSGESGSLTDEQVNLLQKNNACIKHNNHYWYKYQSVGNVHKFYSLEISQRDSDGEITIIQTIYECDLSAKTYVMSADFFRTYTRNQIDTKIAQAISSVYKYKGSVATYSDLPSSDLTIGDVYNVEDTGDNYAWTGTTWDKLAGTVDLSDYATKSELTSGLATKQNTLVNQQNIKSINNQSLLGSGNINISGGGGNAVWGEITGTLSEQTDLDDELQDIREVAEGKCNTFILSDKITRIADGQIYYYDNQSVEHSVSSSILGHFYVYNEVTKEWEDKKTELGNGDYDELSIINTQFNSQNGIETGDGYVIFGGFAGTGATLYLLGLLQNTQTISKYPTKKGDVFLVIETDVPDRWLVSNIGYIGLSQLETSKIDLTNYATKSELTSGLATKQNTLVSGQNIKTINGQSILGSGDLPVSGGGADYTAGYGIDIADDTISVDTDEIATRDFVNSSIATNTATFRGTYNVVSDLSLTTSATHQEIASAIATKLASLSIVPDDNDYVFVSFPNATVSTDFDKYERYKFNGTSWEYEYTLNNSSFTGDFGFPIITAPSSTTLTADEKNAIINGCIINGTISGITPAWTRYIFFPAGDIYSGSYFGLVIVSRNGYTHIQQYQINDNNVLTVLYGTKYIDIDTADNISIVGLNSVNGKSIPAYPSNTGSWTLKCVNGTLTWVEGN